ncbi:MAG: hypothetical protein WAR79_09735 [Melioribacteraceae bacterium]
MNRFGWLASDLEKNPKYKIIGYLERSLAIQHYANNIKMNQYINF